jgi:hypothetical protein
MPLALKTLAHISFLNRSDQVTFLQHIKVYANGKSHDPLQKVMGSTVLKWKLVEY